MGQCLDPDLDRGLPISDPGTGAFEESCQNSYVKKKKKKR